MESLTYFKNIKTTPKKLRLTMAEVKKLTPVAALDYLLYSPHKAGQTLFKIIKSALNNAKNTLKVSDDVLKFKVFTIEEGQKLKRYLPGSRGTMKPVLKRYSHVKIILEAVAAPVVAVPTPEAKVVEEVEKKPAKKVAVKQVKNKS